MLSLKILPSHICLTAKAFSPAISTIPIHNNSPEPLHAGPGRFAGTLACLAQLSVVLSLVTMSCSGQQPPISY